jgi:ketosteroid isomerase-like protein
VRGLAPRPSDGHRGLPAADIIWVVCAGSPPSTALATTVAAALSTDSHRRWTDKRGPAKGSGVEIEQELTAIFTLRDGLVVRFVVFADRAQGLATLGSRVESANPRVDRDTGPSSRRCRQMTESIVDETRLVAQAWSGLDMVKALEDDEFIRGLELWAQQRWDPEFEFRFVGPPPLDERPARGVNELLRAWRQWVEPWESFQFEEFGEPVELTADRILLPVRQRARSKEAGVDIEVRSAAILTFREGRLRHWDAYLHEVDALEVAGLR